LAATPKAKTQSLSINHRSRVTPPWKRPLAKILLERKSLHSHKKGSMGHLQLF